MGPCSWLCRRQRSEGSELPWMLDGDAFSPIPPFDCWHRARARGVRKLICKELAHPVLRIIKRPPRPDSSDETGVPASGYELEMERGVLASNRSYLVQNFRRHHRIIHGAQ